MTAQEYMEKVGRLAEANPNHPLLPAIRRGQSKINELYLAHALKNADASVIAATSAPSRAKNAPVEDSETDDELEPDDPADERLRLMRVDLRKLFSERAILSDRFHTLPSVAERAQNSEEIQIVQRNIGRLMQRIRQWKLTRTLPEDASTKFYVPKDGLDLARAQNSLRVRISRKTKESEALRKNTETNNAAARKLETILDSLARLKGELKEVDSAIAELKKT